MIICNKKCCFPSHFWISLDGVPQLILTYYVGDIIFETHDPLIGWDGSYGNQGVDVQSGVYTYKISFKTPQFDDRREILGHLNVSTVMTQLESSNNQLNVFVSSVMTQITWTHHLEILVSCNSAEEKFFYLLMTKKERWSVRDLRRHIKTATFERTMLANQQVDQVQQQIHQDISNVFRDSYVFEFLNIPELHSEQTLRKTLIKNLSAFMKELGNDFLFVGEEFKLSVGMQDFYIDLLFYHRDLQCLVAFELKTETFSPQSLAQINFYLEA